jgi:glycosyltransferase involved in cell wall biosynthesis
LAEAMAKMAGDAKMRRRFGANARALVESRFSAEGIGRQTVALYDSLIGR